MAILFIIVLIVTLILVNIHVHDFVSKSAMYIFIFYFLGSLLISSFNPNDFYPVSAFTYVVFLVGTMSFIIGFLSYKIKRKEQYVNIELLSKSVDKVSRNKILLLCLIAFIVFCYPYVIKALALAAVQGGAEMENKDELIFGGGNLVTIVYNAGMAVASVIAMVVLAASIILPNRKKRLIMILVTILLQLFYVVLSGGRGTLFAVILSLVFVYICFHANDKKIRISRKQFFSFGVILVFVFIGMTTISNYRKNGEFNIEQNERKEALESMGLTFLNYTVVPINLLDISFKEDYVEKLNGYRYGTATFSGVDLLVQSVAKRFGINYDTDFYIVHYLQDNRKQCAKNRDYNYAYSMFFFNYMDFGLLGVILIPFLFGKFFRYIIYRLYINPTFSRMLIVVLLFNMMFLSHFTSPFIRPWDVFLMFSLLVWDWLVKQRVLPQAHKYN